MEQIGTADRVATVGEIVEGRYEIMKRLGEGGFAKVYLAHDTVIERDVAIKFLDLRGIHGTDDMLATVLERFRREAKLAARIRHRNVVNILDIGQVGDDTYSPFIVMELLNGHDLEDQLNDFGPMRPELLLPLYIDCLDALGEAHDLGIVHKDLKPSNLFLSDPNTRSEALRIVDFGIAHIKNGPGDSGERPDPPDAKERSGRLTATGQILGTLQYLTPEYIASQTVTPALDVYQMALILVELLSGDRVIKTDNPFECLRIHTFGLLELPEYLLASPLGPVLRRALASEVADRTPDANAFAEELSKIDPATIPPSPLFDGEGGVIATAQFLNTTSHAAIPRPTTGDHTAAAVVPNTGEHHTGAHDIGLSLTLDPADVTPSIQATSSPPVERNLAPALTTPVVLEDEPVSNDLKVAVGALAGLIILAIVAVGFLATRGGDPPEPDTKPIAHTSPDSKIGEVPDPPEKDPIPEVAVVEPKDVPEVVPVIPTPAAPSCDAGPKEYCVRFVSGPDGVTASTKGPVETVDADALLFKVTRKSSKVSFSLDAPGFKRKRLSMRSLKLRAGELVDYEVSLSPDKKRPVATTKTTEPDDLLGAVAGIEPDPKTPPDDAAKKPPIEKKPPVVKKDPDPLEIKTNVIIKGDGKTRKGDNDGFGVIED